MENHEAVKIIVGSYPPHPPPTGSVPDVLACAPIIITEELAIYHISLNPPHQLHNNKYSCISI